ncbi:hypothetical protein ACFW08_05925 [Streptomyces sp. NPDC058960]|uniref:hypothetical protein n=1 Tax=Streptomyces sp. NPDC058960 TaxID=3346679 RepID=UPI0036BDFB9A
MSRRTLARNSLLTFAAQPWTLFNDGGDGGGGGTPQVNEHGFPDATPVAEMSAEHQAAYWRHHSRKWEQTAKAAPDAAELERLRAAEAELAQRKAADMTDAERLKAEADAAKAEAEAAKAQAATATAQLLRTTVAADKKLTPEQAVWLQGSTKEELEASADKLLAAFGSAGNGGQGEGSGSSFRSGGNRGSDVGSGSKGVDAGEDLYRQRHGKN